MFHRVLVDLVARRSVRSDSVAKSVRSKAPPRSCLLRLSFSLHIVLRAQLADAIIAKYGGTVQLVYHTLQPVDVQQLQHQSFLGN